MEDTAKLKSFIDGSDFPPEVKKALFDCVLLEIRKSSSSEYLKVIRSAIEDSKLEN